MFHETKFTLVGTSSENQIFGFCYKKALFQLIKRSEFICKINLTRQVVSACRENIAVSRGLTKKTVHGPCTF